jgi:ABC-type amino acid transport substrate-binding protein
MANASGPAAPRRARPRWIRDMAALAMGIALLGGVYLLAPDTSYSEAKKAGLITACIPASYPPLVTGNTEAPGIDIELLEELAGRLGLRLRLQTVVAMGKDLDPRNWGVSRARCQLLAGGVVLSPLTQSFLDSTPPHLATGWSIISAAPEVSLEGKTVGVFVGLTGLDRTGLSSHLRQAGASITLLRSTDALMDALGAGRIDLAVTESLLARQLAYNLEEYTVSWLADDMGRYPIGLGLWKGDLTLKRELVSALGEMENEGLIEALQEKYRIAPISEASKP